MQTSMKIAVAGATGRVGRHVVDVLKGRGHDIVEISRSHGVDVITTDGLAQALEGVECVVDATTGPSPEQEAATEFFLTATHNLHEIGSRAGVQRLVVVSIVGTDRFPVGYGVAKVAQEQAALAGPIPARIVRATQFHEFVGQLVDWGTQGDVAYVPNMRTQLVAARSVGEVLADFAADPAPVAPGASIAEVGGPRAENLVEMATLLVARRGDNLRIEGVADPNDPDGELDDPDVYLPGPHAALVGPTFEEWLASHAFDEWLASTS